MELIYTFSGKIIIIIFALINVFSFALMFIDKHRVIRNKNSQRIPEGIIFFSGIVGGAIGVYFSMFILRHKIRKWYFQLGVPLLILQNLVTVHYLASRLM